MAHRRDRIESFINENKALTRRMFGTFPPPPPDLGPEVSPPVEMEPFETVEFDVPPTEDPFALDAGFSGPGLEAAELPPSAPSGESAPSGGGRGQLRRVGRDGGTSGGRAGLSRGDRRGGREPVGRGAGERQTARRGSERPPPAERGTTSPARGKGRQEAAGPNEFWATAESSEFRPERGDFGTEREELEENSVNVDAKSATPAVDAAGSGGNSTNSTSGPTSNSTDLTAPSGAADNFTNVVDISTEPELSTYFDETGPSAGTGSDAGFVDRPPRAGQRR